MAENSPVSIRLTQGEEKIVDELKEETGSKSRSETLRRSVAQASFLQRHADKDGYVTIRNADGELIKFPVRADAR